MPDRPDLPDDSASGDPLPGVPVVVLGLMGAGKTTVARTLAERWHRPLRDSDLDLQARFGRTAAELAARSGAEGLHALEAEHLFESLASTPTPVIAAAASVVERADCRTALQRAAVVWLDPPLEDLIARQSSPDRHRPVYHPDLRVMLTAMDAVRRPLFRQVADVTLRPTGVQSPLASAVAIEQGLSALAGRDHGAPAGKGRGATPPPVP